MVDIYESDVGVRDSYFFHLICTLSSIESIKRREAHPKLFGDTLYN